MQEGAAEKQKLVADQKRLLAETPAYDENGKQVSGPLPPVQGSRDADGNFVPFDSETTAEAVSLKDDAKKLFSDGADGLGKLAKATEIELLVKAKGKVLGSLDDLGAYAARTDNQALVVIGGVAYGLSEALIPEGLLDFAGGAGKVGKLARVAGSADELAQVRRAADDIGSMGARQADEVASAAKYLNDIGALGQEINRRADVAVQRLRAEISNGGNVVNPGSKAHEYFQKELLQLQDELGQSGSTFRVATEEFRDVTGRVVKVDQLPGKNPAGSRGLDAVIYDGGKPVQAFDLKTYVNRPKGYTQQQLQDLGKRFSIPDPHINIKPIFIKR